MLFFLHRGQRPGHSRSNPNPNYEQGPSLSQNSFCPSLQYTLRIKQLAARGKVEGKIRGTVPTSAGCGDMIICYTNHSAWKNLSSNWCSHHPNPSDHSPSHSPYQKMHVSCRTCHSRKHLPKHKGPTQVCLLWDFYGQQLAARLLFPWKALLAPTDPTSLQTHHV